jgi:hypothetical protein
VHDAEELAAIPGWTERARPRLERRLPWVRPAVWDRLAAADDQVAVAVALMGVLVAAGARAGGGGGSTRLRSPRSARTRSATSRRAR